MSDGGKGSRPRPFSVDRKTFEDNWDRIFNNRPQETTSKLPNNSNKETEK